MPYEISSTTDQGLLITGSGIFTDQDLHNSFKAAYEHIGRYQGICYVYLDLTNCPDDDIHVSNAQIKRTAELDIMALDANPELRLALLANTNYAFGLGRARTAEACRNERHNGRCLVSADRAGLRKWAAQKPH